MSFLFATSTPATPIREIISRLAATVRPLSPVLGWSELSLVVFSELSLEELSAFSEDSDPAALLSVLLSPVLEDSPVPELSAGELLSLLPLLSESP